MAKHVGDTAPDATAFVRPREPVQLRDYLNQPLVLLFPLGVLRGLHQGNIPAYSHHSMRSKMPCA